MHPPDDRVRPETPVYRRPHPVAIHARAFEARAAACQRHELEVSRLGKEVALQVRWVHMLIGCPLAKHGWRLVNREHELPSFVPLTDGLHESPGRKFADAKRADTFSSQPGAYRISNPRSKQPRIEGCGDGLELDQVRPHRRRSSLDLGGRSNRVRHWRAE